MKILTMCAALLSVSLTACAQVALRAAMLNAPDKSQFAAHPFHCLTKLGFNPFLISGVAIYGVSVLLWLYVLSQTPVSVAYPLSAIGFVLAAIFAFLFLNENMTFLRLAGVLIICVGVVVVSRTA